MHTIHITEKHTVAGVALIGQLAAVVGATATGYPEIATARFGQVQARPQDSRAAGQLLLVFELSTYLPAARVRQFSLELGRVLPDQPADICILFTRRSGTKIEGVHRRSGFAAEVLERGVEVYRGPAGPSGGTGPASRIRSMTATKTTTKTARVHGSRMVA